MVLALAFLFVLSIVIYAAVEYSSSAGRSAKVDQARTAGYALAEAGLNDAISVLSNSANDPTSPTLLGSASSPRVETFNTGTVSTYGVLNASTLVWTVTATSSVRNPTGAAALRRTVTAQVQVSNVSAWDRIYDDDTACMTLNNVSIPSPFYERGCLNMDGTATLTGPKVVIGGNLVLKKTTNSVGTSSTPIASADIGGTCKYVAAVAHTPCTAADNVFARAITASPSGLTLPTFDWSYWYQNAAPGPMHPCTTSSGSVPQFDKNTTWNHDNPSQEITPEASNPPGTSGSSSYTCQVRDGSGNLLGELSWNNATRVLTISGTIFFDGDAVFHDSAVSGSEYVVHVNGRGTIMSAHDGHIDEAVCMGGSGTTDCRTSMSSWNPSQNLLVYAVANSVNFHENGSAFQGVLYCLNACQMTDSISSSGPVLSGNLTIGSAGPPTFYTWPPLTSLPAAEVAAGGPWTVSVLSQS